MFRRALFAFGALVALWPLPLPAEDRGRKAAPPPEEAAPPPPEEEEGPPADAPLPDLPLPRDDFEEGALAFQVRGGTAARTTAFARGGRGSLGVETRFPEPCAVTFELREGLSGAARLRLFLYLPKEAPADVATALFLKDKDGTWFQRYARGPLPRGEWTAVEADLSDGSADLRPDGHSAAWGAQRLEGVREAGLLLTSAVAHTGRVFLDDLSFERSPAGAAVPKVTALAANRSVVPRLGLFELSFQVTPAPANPFDPDELKVDARFWPAADPDRLTTLPAFWRQDYARSLGAEGERLIPVGPGEFAVRFTPEEEGEHQWQIDLETPEGFATTARGAFRVTPAEGRGFVRVSEKDPRYFEFSDGSFFFPVGHNIRSPNDPRCTTKVYREGRELVPPDDGTFTYDRLMARMAQSGENVLEVWMASWWLALEWTDRWRGYQGLGRYNLENAWRLDHLLETAERHDLYLHLVLENHGKICDIRQGTLAEDIEWMDNPFHARNGGYLRSPEEFFTDRRARRQYQKFLRYLVGRYAWSSRIMGIELISELDLTGSRQPDEIFRSHGRAVGAWHDEMADFLERTDPYGHIKASHFSGNVDKVSSAVAKLPALDYVAVDGYRNPKMTLEEVLRRTQERRGKEGWKKPIWITEYGGDWNAYEGLPREDAFGRLVADLHNGAWISFLTGHPGTPLFWWFDLIDREDLYPHLKGLAAFARGEDLRGEGWIPVRPRVAGLAYLQARGLIGPEPSGGGEGPPTRALLWVHDQRILERWPPAPYRAGAGTRVSISGLAEGTYEAEFYDTLTGEVVARRTLSTRAEGGEGVSLVLELPAFENDLGVKARRVGGPEAQGPREPGAPPPGGNEAFPDLPETAPGTRGAER